MVNFVLKLEIDGNDSRSWKDRLTSIGHSAEQEFWDHFKAAAPNFDAKHITQIHAKIREQLPVRLKQAVTTRLMSQLAPPPVVPTEQSAPAPAAAEPESDHGSAAVAVEAAAARVGEEKDTEAKRLETLQAIDAIEFQVVRIWGGSLEILLFALGFAKLVALTGVSAGDFAKIVEIAGPIAMNAVFGAHVPLVSEARPLPTNTDEQAALRNGEAMTQLSAIRQPPGISYFLPALFAFAVFAGGAWLLSIFAEKAATTLSSHDKELAEERKEFAKRSNALLEAMTQSQAARDTAQLANSQLLFNAIMDFNKKVDGDRVTRDAAVLDFVKAKLETDTRPKAPVSGPAKQACDEATRLRWVQFALKERGLYTGNIDGILGKQSQAALMTFQYRSSLPPNRVVDAATLEKLGVTCLMASAAN